MVSGAAEPGGAWGSRAGLCVEQQGRVVRGAAGPVQVDVREAGLVDEGSWVMRASTGS